MKLRSNINRALSIMLAVVLAFAFVPKTTADAAKAKIDSSYKTVELKYNAHGDSTYMSAANMFTDGLVINAKKKAKYSIKIKNTKVAKIGKDNNKNEIIYSTGLGKTKATVYEKVGKAKKKSIGTFTISVTDYELPDVVSDSVFADTVTSISIIHLPLHLGVKTFDAGDYIDNTILNNKTTGIKFDKSEYNVTYSIQYVDDMYKDPDDDSSSDATSAVSMDASRDPLCANVDDKGLVTALRVGDNTGLVCHITFNDGTYYDEKLNIEVTDTSIVKAGTHNINNIRDYIVGLDTPVDLADGTKAPQICFDNASTTPAFTEVQDAVNEEMLTYGSIGRGFSQKSNHCTDLYNSTRNKVLDFLSADHEKYTCFYVNSTTDGLNKLASALIESKDDLVLTTRIEHHANDLSWRNRCKVIYAEVDDKGRVIYDDIEKMLKKNKGKVKLVSVTAASNVTGYVTDVHRVAKLAHQYGAMIVVDGAQIVAHRAFSMMGDINDKTDDIDFIAFSAHKMYSPYGGGAVVGLSDVLNKHLPTFYGGGTVKLVGDDWEIYKEAPATYEAGSPNYPGVVGLGKAIDVISDVGFDDIQAHEKRLNKRLIDGLKKLPNVIIYGDTENIDDKVGVVTFNFTDVNTYFLATELNDLGAVATRRGSFCAHPYVWRLMGIPDESISTYEGCADAKSPGMLRVSFGIYNTEEEVDQLLELLPKAIEETQKIQVKYDAVPEF